MRALPKGLSIIEHDNKILVKLYNTMIAIVDNNTGVVNLDSGLNDIGRMSQHTKKCLNLVLREKLHVYIKQTNFQWEVIDTLNSSKIADFDNNGLCTIIKEGGLIWHK